MLAKEDVKKYTLKSCEKMTFYEMVDALAEEIYQHEITRSELMKTNEKLESSRRTVKRLKEKQ